MYLLFVHNASYSNAMFCYFQAHINNRKYSISQHLYIHVAFLICVPTKQQQTQGEQDQTPKKNKMQRYKVWCMEIEPLFESWVEPISEASLA